MNETKICLLGGDTRQTALARHLAKSGIETAVWGVPDLEGEDFSGVRCFDAAGAVRGSQVVILPLPATTDGVRLNCPARKNEGEWQKPLRLTELFEMFSKDTLLLAGHPGEVLRSMARNANIRLIDYYDCEEVQLKNAIPTAEGALAIAMNELPITIHQSRCTVVGYGRIGERLCRILHALGAKVSVVARSPAARCRAETEGYMARTTSEFLATPGEMDVLFTTVPAPIIGANTLAQIAPTIPLIELASAPGGFDAAALRATEHRYIRAASLPGKVAPLTAGRILYERILCILREEGILP